MGDPLHDTANNALVAEPCRFFFFFCGVFCPLPYTVQDLGLLVFMGQKWTEDSLSFCLSAVRSWEAFANRSLQKFTFEGPDPPRDCNTVLELILEAIRYTWPPTRNSQATLNTRQAQIRVPCPQSNEAKELTPDYQARQSSAFCAFRTWFLRGEGW